MKNKITKKSTIRDVMQVLGTDLLRQGFNNNIHVAATIGSIKENEKVIITDMRFPNEMKAVKDRCGICIRINSESNEVEKASNYAHNILVKEYGEDELREGENYKEQYQDKFNKLYDDYFNNEHESETALDDYEFDYIIDNNGTIEELVEKVKQILVKENIL